MAEREQKKQTFIVSYFSSVLVHPHRVESTAKCIHGSAAAKNKTFSSSSSLWPMSTDDDSPFSYRTSTTTNNISPTPRPHYHIIVFHLLWLKVGILSENEWEDERVGGRGRRRTICDKNYASGNGEDNNQRSQLLFHKATNEWVWSGNIHTKCDSFFSLSCFWCVMKRERILN